MAKPYSEINSQSDKTTRRWRINEKNVIEIQLIKCSASQPAKTKSKGDKVRLQMSSWIYIAQQ